MTATKSTGCPYCGSTDGCNFTGGPISQNFELSADDWKRIYWFLKYVQLPFLHQMITDARERNKTTTDPRPQYTCAESGE
jgi:hypothetical protein